MTTIKFTNATDTVTCRVCGKTVFKRNAVGIGINGSMRWTCVDCVTPQSMDEAFVPLGDAIRSAKEQMESKP